MQRIAAVASITMVLLGWSAATAHAQMASAPGRWFINVNGAGQATTEEVRSNFLFDLYGEGAAVSVVRKPKGALFDLTAGTWVFDEWGAGITFSRRSASSDGALTGSIPNPDVFGNSRAVATTLNGLSHAETWFAAQVFYGLTVTDRIFAMGYIGPAVVRVKSDVVGGVNVTETPSGPVVDVDRTSASKTFAGVNIGIDVQYFLTRQFNWDIGVGGFARYQVGRGTLAGTKLTVGGMQLGGGLRVKF
jgi:hypothetical protein